MLLSALSGFGGHAPGANRAARDTSPCSWAPSCSPGLPDRAKDSGSCRVAKFVGGAAVGRLNFELGKEAEVITRMEIEVGHNPVYDISIVVLRPGAKYPIVEIPVFDTIFESQRKVHLWVLTQRNVLRRKFVADPGIAEVVAGAKSGAARRVVVATTALIPARESVQYKLERTGISLVNDLCS